MFTMRKLKAAVLDMEKFIKSIWVFSMITFLVGAFSGIYTRWQHHTSDKSFPVFGILAILSLTLSLLFYIFKYKGYPRLSEVSKVITHVWVGLIFSVLTFTPVAYDHMFDSAKDLDIVDMLLIASTFSQCLAVLLDRIHNYGSIQFQMVTSKELCLLVGFVFGFVFGSQTSHHLTQMSFLAFAIICNLVAIHLKSKLSLLNALLTSTLVASEFFPAIKLQYNPFCLATFSILLFFEAVIDMYFSKYSTVDRWKGVLTSWKWQRKLFLLVVFICECVYVVCAVLVTISHQRAVVIVPIFIIFLIPWVSAHFIFFVDCWGFLMKLEECSSHLRRDFDTNTMLDVLASKGVGHFCLVSKSIVVLTVATTVLVAIPSWQVTNPWFITSFLIVMPIESMVYSVLSSLAKSLGGTAIGFAMVLPCSVESKNGLVVVIPDTMFQTMSRTAIELNTLVSRFFSEHIIHNFGTELCTSGLTIQSLQSKLETFFSQRVLPGVAYDSYVLYFSGPVHDNGDWALLENNVFSLKDILNIWEKVNKDTGSRLMLTLDTKNSYKWLHELQKLDTKHFVSIQVGEFENSNDVETATTQVVGDLTRLWVKLNSSGNNLNERADISIEEIHHIQLRYMVSKTWCDFRFHTPTQQDISQHIEESFPAIVQPVMRLFNKLPQRTNLFCICEKCVAFIRKVKMKWLPPLMLDTGHGFKLIYKNN